MATNSFANWTKMFGDFKSPSMDMSQILATYKRNAETASAVMQIMTESTQAIAKRQAEILRSNAEQALKASKGMTTQASPETAAAKNADFAKSWMEYNVNSLREIAEMSTKSTQEALDVINKRVAEQMKEFSDVASSAAHSAVHATKKKAA